MCYNFTMSDKRIQFAEKVATHLVTHGLSDAGIRALAKAAGTSDRMLIYYFGSKEQLIRESMGLVVGGLSAQLDALLGNKRRSRARLLDELTEACSDPAMLPSIQVWFEVVGLAARDIGPYKDISHGIAGVFIDWIERHLVKSQQQEAADLFAHLEGRNLLHIIGIKRE